MRYAFVMGVASALAALAMSSSVSADELPINGGPKIRSAAGLSAPQALTAPQPNPMEMIYATIAPCRVFGGQAITTNQTKTFQITGSGNLSSQGGPTTGCGVPASARAVAINLSATGVSGGGILTAFAQGTTKPAIGSLLIQKTESITSGLTVAISAIGQLSIFSNKPTTMFGDVVGYYAPQIQVYMNPTGTAYAGTSRIVSTTKLGTGSYQIVVDRNMQLCSVHVNIDGGYYYGSAYPSGNSIYVNTWSLSGGTATAVDLYHNVSAKC